MEGSGRVPTTASCQVQACAADAVLARYLGVKEGAPVLGVDQMTFDQNGDPLEIIRVTYRSDRYRFRATLSGEQLLR
jgi:GntR family transcriptional regulator